ncbi:hypothetical protein [Pyrobaculum aerophilum]|uniref:Uncharacterized protein n=2 Tax=Pyrobaculum aerophilum TaxID=13773 RepID=Q8ZYT4_PYRAE|nr:MULTISPECIES: hypothetical protein [Pyrobaculum]AAL62909.1 hypothetical protein PAE0635 [Pyrobaculum aerophilum str. IM2]MCX8135894.1 hypothetical protein [Pyrobaculum aerophilum]HII46044.1 hypothetical protein [Pyrobaculum aerophilum]
MFVQYVRYSPVGEYLRLVIMQRLIKGPATVEEINGLAKKVVEGVGIKYDWRVWPELLRREILIKDGVVELTKEGRWIYEQTKEEVLEYVKRFLRTVTCCLDVS